MKKSILFLTNILCATILLFSFTGCRAEELFSERTLREYDIPWLTTPENTAEERQYHTDTYYAYEAEIGSEEAYLAYCQSILSRMNADAYNVGHFVSVGGDDNVFDYDSYIVLAPSESLQDYLHLYSDDTVTICEIYYTADLFGDYEEARGGYSATGLKYLTVWFTHAPDQNDMHDFRITLSHGHEQSYFRMPKAGT